MEFWIAIGVVALVSLLAVAWPIRAALSDNDTVYESFADETDTARVFYEQQLAELQNDLSSSKLDESEFVSAKLELDRELLRQSRAMAKRGAGMFSPSLVIGLSVPLIVAVAVLTYFDVGNPGTANLPLADRIQQGENINIADAIKKIELRLQDVPDELQGWKVIAPVYMRQQAFEKASNAFENIVRIEGESADNLTNLAEAKVLVQQGDAAGEPLDLLKRALLLDPNHLRAQFYLAGEATQKGQFKTAVSYWTNILRDPVGDEPWLDAARAGLKAAEKGLKSANAESSGPSQDQVDAAMDLPETDRTEMIQNMVDGLALRLSQSGGSPQEWQRLLRARLVQGELELARNALEGARRDLQSNGDLFAEFEAIAAAELDELKKLEKK